MLASARMLYAWRFSIHVSMRGEEKDVDTSHGTVFSYHPLGHRAFILNYRRFQWIEHLAAELLRQIAQQLFVDQIALGAVGQQEAASGDIADLIFDFNRRCQ